MSMVAPKKRARKFGAVRAKPTMPFSVRNNPDSIVVSFDKKHMSADEVLHLLEALRFEDLCRKADFDPSLVQLGEQMKAEWWAKNGKRILREAAR